MDGKENGDDALAHIFEITLFINHLLLRFSLLVNNIRVSYKNTK